MASKTISVRIFLHDQLVDTRSFDQDVIKLGRLGSSHLLLDHEAVGRMHAVIELGQDGNARLVDLGTTSGTRLNGALIDRSHALHSGDQLELGPYRIELAIANPMPAAERGSNNASVRALQPTASPAPLALDLSTVEDASEQVAEVVATYGRSILDVTHVGQARSRRASAIPLLGLGGVLFAGGLGLFGYEVAQPWAEHTAAVAEAQSLHRELPQAPGLGTGSLGLLLAFMGLVPFLAGSLRLREQPLEAYTIGESSEASFKVSGASLPNPAATPLVQRVNGGYALAFTPSMGGEVEFGGQRMSLDELVAAGRAAVHAGAYLYPLPSGAKARVDHGDIRFNVNLVNRGAVVAGRGQVDWAFWGYFGGTATIATAFYMLMRAMPDDALAMQLEDDQAAAKFASYFHQADNKPADEPIETEPELADNSDAPSGGKSAARAPGADGQMGDKRSRDSAKSYAMSGPKDATPRMARDFDVDAAARNAGILGILAQQDTHFLASVNGGAFAVGNDDQDAWGTMVGTEIGEAYGTGGLGLIGSGRGGGDGSGLIGMGGTGLLGHGPGTGGKSYGPKGGTGFGPRAPKTPVASIGKDVVVGDVDKDLIRRVVRAHINEVRSCYNSGLTRNPNLDGRVTIQFSILGNGKVGSSLVQENTTKDNAVGDCIAKAVKRWSFPRVRNGGTAVVTYPFRLTAH